MGQEYNQYLDFSVIEECMQEQIEEVEKSGKDPLCDIGDFSKETMAFFNDVVNAKSTSDLSAYSEATVEEAEKLLLEQKPVMTFIQNTLSDESILSRDNLSELERQIGLRALISRRIL